MCVDIFDGEQCNFHVFLTEKKQYKVAVYVLFSFHSRTWVDNNGHNYNNDFVVAVYCI